MAKSKKTKKAPKVSVARVLGLLLLGLLAAGAVANVIKALPNEEEQTTEEVSNVLKFTGDLELEIELSEGTKTWNDLLNDIEDEYDFSYIGYLAFDYEGSTYSIKNTETGESVYTTDTIDTSITYRLVLQE